MAQKRKSTSGKGNARGKSKKQYVDHEASESDLVGGETKPNRPVCGGGDAEDEWVSTFLGKPIPEEEARKRWPHRYNKENEEEVPQARYHYKQAEIEGYFYSLNDDCSIKGIDGEKDYICRIIELFEALDGSHYFTAQWYYRACDTVIQTCANQMDEKYVFFSEDKNDNSLGCLLEKLNILSSPPADLVRNEEFRSTFDYYYDKMYLPAFTSFVSLTIDKTTSGNESSSTICSDGDVDSSCNHGIPSDEKTLLDLYSGCGAMSTGLCLGANSNGVKLVTKWAVDINQYACESLRLNHRETKVRNESAEDFLNLLVEWEKLCATFRSPALNDSSNDHENSQSKGSDECDDDDVDDNEDELDEDEFEVEELYAICYGDPNETGEAKLHFKVRWKGYGPEYDTWEPFDGLGSCEEKLKEFVLKGYEAKILPLPGTVDVICGGPPCQGISGFNRFRNKEAPLEDPKNNQVLVFMDIVAHLKPKFVLMENVVDIMKFAEGFLGRYALARLVKMGYQARMGMMAAGAFGLPQYRMRMFMWGALPTQRLPQYPLPTHHVVKRGCLPTKFEPNRVDYEAGQPSKLKQELLLADAIFDLPNVENDENRDAMPYGDDPKSDFQRFIRLPRNEMPGCFESEAVDHQLYDHFPLHLNQDDYERVCQIPKEKGANFRDLPGVRVCADNKVKWDPDVPRKYVSSGKPLVPDYAMTFKKGYSTKPFRRLWWDETIPTVVTRAEPHNQAILHPLQDRVLTVRENARLQGFPDYYQLTGPVKERYVQVGNAVAVPVARALGHSLALALRGLLSSAEPVFALPEDFPHLRNTNASSPEIGSLID